MKPTPPPPSASAQAPQRRSPRPATYELIEKIVGLQLRGVGLTELADGVLPSLLDLFAAGAGGLLLYHSEDGSLALGASVGLSPSGRSHLETLRANSGWEIPLHGLLNRKAYIIERPGEHPFVPELVPQELAVRMPNLASIPLYRGQLPVGVLLVIADRHPVTEADVMSHVLVFDALSIALDAGLRARGEMPQPVPPDAVLPALVCEPWQDPRAVAQQLEARVRQESEARAALEARLAEAEEIHTRTVQDLEERLADTMRQLEARRAEATRTLEDREAELCRLLDAERDAAQAALAERERTTKEQLSRTRAAANNRVSEEAARHEGAIKELQAALLDRESTFESSLRKLQGALAEREALLAARDRELTEVTADRDHITQAALEAGESIERLNEEIERIRAELDGANAAHARELEKTRVLYERRLEDATVPYRQELAEAEAARATTVAHAEASELRGQTLERELASVSAEAAALRDEREQVMMALGGTEADPAPAIEALRGRIATLEGEAARMGAAHGSLERRLALEVQGAAERAATHQREIEESQAAQQQAIEELNAAHRHDAEEARVAHRREIEQVDAGHRALVAQMQADFQHRLVQGRNEATRMLEETRADFERRLGQLAAAHAETLDRAEKGEARVNALDHELAGMRSEIARLHEERAQVIAAVDEPDAEPATVIRALRGQVVALEGEIGAAREAQGALEQRADEMARAAEARLAEARASAQAIETELRGAIAERDARLAERECAVMDLGQEQERARQVALEAGEVVQRQSGEIERVLAELSAAQDAHAETLARVVAASGRAEALEGEVTALRTELMRLRDEREQVLAAVEDAGAEPAEVIRALRQKVGELERTLSGLAAERSAVERRLAAEAKAHEERSAAHRRDLEARDAAHRHEIVQARASIARLEEIAAQRAALDERLAVAEQERADAERARSEQALRVGALERDLTQSETLLASARAQLEAAVQVAATSSSDAPTARGGAAAARVVERSAGARGVRPGLTAALPRIQVLEPPPAPLVEQRSHRVLEGNAALREQIMFALATAMPKAPAGGTFVANLLAAIPSRLAEIEDAAADGAVVITYASDGSGRSRILGPVRCFADLPSPETVLAAIQRTTGARRIITLCQDVDALLPMKTALGDAGHSVSMAYDPKQALDLLAMFTPEVALVDLRNTPEASAEFLDALPLEEGMVQVLLVHGDASGAVLKRAIGRLMRPTPIDANGLVAACKTMVDGPGDVKKGAAARTPRAPQRPKPTPQRAGPRRLMGRR